ncbi:MFS transporter [Polymorphospora sp. NPDC050346]|uniref:MFS transporter n=1 Tax=Polymorphospora sp. NPDC050346 TaxID=3155780 RepID=UPI0033C96E50
MKRITVTFLASDFLSLFGNAIAGVALPLIVLQTTGSVLGAGIVAAATAIPAMLGGLLTGVVIDRINRRTASIATDLISAGAVAALPVVDLLVGLELGWFILFGILGSFGDVPGMTAREALLPAIVRHGGIAAERLIGVRESLGALAILVGPAAAGGLMLLFDGSTVLWITAATSLGAALVTLTLPRRVGELEAAPVPAPAAAGAGSAADGAGSAADGAGSAADGTGSAAAGIGSAATAEPGGGDVGVGLRPEPVTGWAQLREGWRLLFRGSPFLLAVTLLNLVLATVLAALQGLVLPVHFTLLDQPGRLGLVLSSIALGTLVGGAAYAVAGSRGPRRVWLVAGFAASVVGIAVIGALPAAGLVFAGAFVVGGSMGMLSGLLGVLMLERIPDRMRGRILGTQNAILTGAAPLGIVLAAVAVEYAGLGVTAVALAAVWAVAAVAAVSSRALRNLDGVRESV